MTLPYKINAQKSALLVIDMQNGFVSKRGLIQCPNASSILPNITKLIEKVRCFGIQVIWTRVAMDNVRQGVYPRLWPSHFEKSGKPYFYRNSWHHKFVDEIFDLIKEEDIIIEKDRYSAFYQTNLDLILRQNKIETLIFAGVMTNVCVESTIRDAYERDYIPIMLSDCTATMSEDLQYHSENLVRMLFGYVEKSDAIINLTKD